MNNLIPLHKQIQEAVLENRCTDLNELMMDSRFRMDHLAFRRNGKHFKPSLEMAFNIIRHSKSDFNREIVSGDESRTYFLLMVYWYSTKFNLLIELFTRANLHLKTLTVICTTNVGYFDVLTYILLNNKCIIDINFLMKCQKQLTNIPIAFELNKKNDEKIEEILEIRKFIYSNK
jgi:hypothetical protein